MERLSGRRRLVLDAPALAYMVDAYARVLVDLGTGDGRFVDLIARRDPGCLAIGIDACREPLSKRSRRAPANVLYLIANALTLPTVLDGVATRITVNFPWGTLLTGLLEEQSPLYAALLALARPSVLVEVHLNAGALAEAGWTLEAGAACVRQLLRASGFSVRPPVAKSAADLRAYPSTWAHRLAVGADPRAVYLTGTLLPLHDYLPLSRASGAALTALGSPPSSE